MSPGFIAEREGELAAGAELLARARRNAGGLLLIEGPAGIGKTTVLEAISANADGYMVLRASGDELDRGFAFGVARQLFARQLARDPGLRERALSGVAQLAEPLVSGFDPQLMAASSPQAARHALTWLAANLADERPLLLSVDDLQWADPASLGWLIHLVRRLPDLRMAVVAAWRIGEPGCDEDMLDRLRDLPATQIVRPAPLSAEGVAEVVSRALGEHSGEVLAEACTRASGGNPFLLAELLRALPAVSVRSPADVSGVRPESITRSVSRRLGRLPETAVRAVEACAVLGDGCELRQVEELAGLSRGEVVAALDGLAAAEILTPGRPLRFVHPLVRAAVYGRLPVQARGQAHADAARLLAADGADAPRIAAHLLAAPPAHDPWACGVLVAAGAAALDAGAPAEAVALFERALAEPPAEAEGSRVLLALGTAELRLGRPSGAAHLTAVIRDADDVADRARAAIALLNHSILTGHQPDPHLIDCARSELGSEHRELSLELEHAKVASGVVASESSRTAAADLTALAEGLAGETPGERLLLAGLSWVLAVSGQGCAEDCAALASRALAGGQLVREWPDVLTIAAAAQIMLIADYVEQAQIAIETGLEVARARGSEIGYALWSANECYRGWLQGELVEAEAAGRSALAAASELPVAIKFVLAYFTRVLIDRGQLEEADALFGAHPPTMGRTILDLVALRSLARLRLVQARFEEAAGTALRLGELLASRGNAAHPGIPWRLDAAAALAATGNQPKARELIAAQWPDTRSWNTPRLTGTTLAAEGLVEGGQRGIERLRQAADTLAVTPARLAYAEALLHLGTMLRRHKQRAEAREVLLRALDIADRTGASLIFARAREEIAATGARPRRARLTGVEALTPSELRVARMAAAGMGNREIAQALFVTHRTVESQLGSAYRKLDITSRGKLPDALRVAGETTAAAH
jgi:DNA-binding CsgD family transcriptional regulator